MALYKISVRVLETDLLVSAENITEALTLMQEAKGLPQECVVRIEEFCDIKCALDACYESAEDKLEALLTALSDYSGLNQTLAQDIANTVVYDAVGIGGMVKEIPSTES